VQETHARAGKLPMPPDFVIAAPENQAVKDPEANSGVTSRGC
jgi:hypothetical protein